LEGSINNIIVVAAEMAINPALLIASLRVIVFFAVCTIAKKTFIVRFHKYGNCFFNFLVLDLDFQIIPFYRSPVFKEGDKGTPLRAPCPMLCYLRNITLIVCGVPLLSIFSK
jgi:hypothetical protein